MRNVLQSGFEVFIVMFFLTFFNLYSFDMDKVIDSTIDNYSKIRTIKAEITDDFYSKTKSGKFSGKYYSIGDSTVIYFTKPYRQSILITKDSVYWYFPDDKKVYMGAKINKSDVKSFGRENNLSFLNKTDYNFEKKLVGNIFTKKIKLTITPKIKRKSKFSGIIAYINPKVNVITDVEFYDLAGYEIMEQHFRKFTKVKDINLARSVSTIIFTPMGNIETNIKYKNIKINDKIYKDIFNLNIPFKYTKVFPIFNPKGGGR